MADSSSNTNSNELIERSSISSIEYQLNDNFTINQKQNLHNSTNSSEFDQMMMGETSPMKINSSIFPNLLAPNIIQKFNIHQMLKGNSSFFFCLVFRQKKESSFFLIMMYDHRYCMMFIAIA